MLLHVFIFVEVSCPDVPKITPYDGGYSNGLVDQFGNNIYRHSMNYFAMWDYRMSRWTFVDPSNKMNEMFIIDQDTGDIDSNPHPPR